MTDVAGAEVSVEPVPPMPEATAELDAAPPPQAPEAVASADAPAERALPEIEYAIGSTRQAILDHFLDTEGDQSMAQIKAALPNILPGTIEACVRSERQQGRLLRVSPGVYRLAP